MELKFDLNYAISDERETLHRQLGISDERAKVLHDSALQHVKRFAIQDIIDKEHYPIAQMFADVIAPCETIQEVVLLVSKASKTLVEVGNVVGDPAAMFLAFLESRRK